MRLCDKSSVSYKRYLRIIASGQIILTPIGLRLMPEKAISDRAEYSVNHSRLTLRLLVKK